MKILPYLFATLVAPVGFFAGGQLAQETSELAPLLGATLGAVAGFGLALVLVKLWRPLLALALVGGIAIVVYHWMDRPDINTNVSVTFEIQAMGAGTSYSYGVTGGQGSFGTMSEGIESKTLYAILGQEVTARAAAIVEPGSHGSTTPSHELICRILVKGEEIYLQGDQGTPFDPAEVICRGPVYFPQDNNRSN